MRRFPLCCVFGLGVVLAVVLRLAGAGASAEAQEELTYEQLAGRLIDLEHLAVLPEPGERCAQWSSFDRASRYDPAAGKYVNWSANNDGPQFIRKEGEKYVLAEMEGPGCIWRIWSALPKEGHVKIYLDGREEPAVDLPFIDYFRGTVAPFDFPMLSYDLAQFGSRGANCYVPIPYQKSCKIVADEGWGRYYHFTYSTFPEGTRVPTFEPQLAPDARAALQRVNDFLANHLGSDPAGKREGRQMIADTVTIPAGKSAELKIAGPRAITALRGRMDLTEREDQIAALRKLVLRISFDDQAEPAVWCPLGDFFGTAPGVNFYRSLPTGMDPEQGAYAYWYMPFAREARVELVNDDTRDRRISFELVHAPLARPMDKLGYFHCKWHRDAFKLPPDRWPDWVMLRTEGRGRFCGVMLHVWNPRGGWWGEGDEKFFVDGEKFPSTIGTGSEDYFGYAWGSPALFQRPFHCQTMTQNNKGHQSVLRWHVADNVPFQKSFEGTIEKYLDNQQRGTLYACVACWYLATGGKDPFAPAPADQRHGYWVVPPLTAGGYRIKGDPPGQVRTQGLAQFPRGKWHNNDQLWWTGAKPGDRLHVLWSVDKSGKFDVAVTLTKARDYAIVQLYVDGKKAGKPIDLYNPDVISTGPIALDTWELEAGEHCLEVEIVGANPEAIKAYMFGLDQILLKPAQ